MTPDELARIEAEFLKFWHRDEVLTDFAALTAEIRRCWAEIDALRTIIASALMAAE